MPPMNAHDAHDANTADAATASNSAGDGPQRPAAETDLAAQSTIAAWALPRS
ncbi:MAG TPA: hypothetical protein VHR45_20420 [Thermoanaerobaculia bacterium]|nr:hypothetical protein [Thermoanaerobaculia bacterium]